MRNRSVLGGGKSGTISRNTSDTTETSISASGGIFSNCTICTGDCAIFNWPISPVAASAYQVASLNGNTSMAALLTTLGTIFPESSAPHSRCALRALPCFNRTGSVFK
jgi:hypothetical protein